ncbi:conserved hypothetical protein [Ricinus communis]|uniref:RNase H type-1 domain-containing protein n=1 Tax=Ricinus communis TaxID=3988 RepID=B9T084_RICCO|nr:conserved hypothetical protein [Ricinus communis]
MNSSFKELSSSAMSTSFSTQLNALWYTAIISSYGTMFNNTSKFQILKSLHIAGKPSGAPSIISVFWRSSPLVWIKVNTDRSAFGSPRSASLGGIFEISRGYPAGCFVFSICNSFAHIAELCAAMFVVLKAKEFGWRQLWLECDSMYVVHLFKNIDMLIPW